jgi:hypothetical protein
MGQQRRNARGSSFALTLSLRMEHKQQRVAQFRSIVTTASPELEARGGV